MSIIVSAAHEIQLATNQAEAFFESHWPRKICLADPVFSEWQFSAPPIAGGNNHSMVAFDTHTRDIVGIMGLNPRPFYFRGDKVQGAELTSWVVAPSQRGTGVGARIIAEIQNRYQVLIGMGISSMALPIYRRSGFRYIRAIPRFIRVINEDTTSTFGSISSLGKKLQNRITPLRYKYSERDISFEDGLFERMHKTFSLFDRGPEHLAWRYTNHPSFTYNTRIIACDGGEALVVYRIEDAVSGLRVMHIMDCIGDSNAMSAALSYIEDLAISENVDFIDSYSTSACLNRFYLAHEWSSIIDDDAVQVPHLFHPVELRNPPTTSLIYWAKERMLDMADLGHLYVSKQDADLDRPVPLYSG